MMSSKLIFTFIVAFLACLNAQVVVKKVKPYDQTNGLDSNGTNVCSYEETISIQVNQTYMTQRFITVYHKKCFWCSPRRKLITQNVLASRIETRYVNRDVYHCCSGWVRNDQKESSCKIPVCSIDCKNGGTCVGPNTCKCKEGFSGMVCQIDNNECADPKIHKCEHVCNNKKGGFYCGCYIGYQLQSDGKSCKDINECNDSPCGCYKDDGVCQSECVNTQGSYYCKCRDGYFLNSAERCEDRNECFESPSNCDHKCVNTPGSFKCQCFSGFRHNPSTSKCEDINECSLNNGGCSHNCINFNGSYTCTCPKGKYLTDNGKTCKDVDLSKRLKIICHSDLMDILACNDITAKINITSVFYGRTSTKLCPSNKVGNLDCVLANAKSQLSSCNGVSSCLVMLNTFPDPCPGIEKYAQVTYKCEIPKQN